MWYLQTTNCLVFIFLSFRGDLAGCRCTAVKNGWNMEKKKKKPPIYFWKHFLPFPHCWGRSQACRGAVLPPASHQTARARFPYSGEGVTSQKPKPSGKARATEESHMLAQRSLWWHQRPLLWNRNTASLGWICHCRCIPCLLLLMSRFVSSYLAGFCV